MFAIIRDALAVTRLPKLTVDLMRNEATTNDPFYLTLVESFYYDAIAPHPRYRVIPHFTKGVAICSLKSDDTPYIRRIEPSGLRNIKKATKLGYSFAPLDYNAHLEDIAHIRRSTDTRQGKVPTYLLNAEVRPISNPRPLNDFHRYDYFGVFREGKLYAYAGCFIAGQLCLLEHIYGHAAHHSDGIVPQLIAGMVAHVGHYSHVQYFCYGSMFGARKPMRRFKKKFLFTPYNVSWNLG